MTETIQPIIHDFTPSPIEQPPLKNEGSCIRRALVAIFTLVLILIIIFTVIALFFNKPTITRLPKLPDNFPTDIPLYNFSDRVYINYLNTEESNSMWHRASLVPRFILGQLVIKINPDISEEEKVLNNNIRLGDAVNISNIQKLLAVSETQENTDQIEIGWEKMSDESPKKVFTYYKKNFEDQDYKVTLGANNDNQKGFYFSKEKVSGEINIEIENKLIIKKITFKVNFPGKEK